MSDLTPATASRAASKKSKKRMRTPRKALFVAFTLLVVLAVAAAGTVLAVRHSINSQLKHIETSLGTANAPTLQSGTQSSPQSSVSAKPLTFLIMGSDSRQSGGDPTDWQYGAQRSDVLILAQLTGDRKGVNLMSIPRDSWVDIPGHGTAKINAAYSWGGADLTIATVQNLTGIQIDHFMVTDFTSFEQLTDALGSVTIASNDHVQTYNGAEALKFVRERYSLPRGDFDRMQRQQAWMRAIMKSSFDQSVLTNPAKASEMIQIVLRHSAVDQTLDFDSMISIASGLTGLRSTGVNFFTIPYLGTGTSDDGQSIVRLDFDKINELSTAWNSDTVNQYLNSHPNLDILGNNPVA